MVVFTQAINEGLKFKDEKEAIEYFKSTLLDKTPLGKLYDEIHNADFGKYTVEATGLNEKEINVSLDKPNHAQASTVFAALIVLVVMSLSLYFIVDYLLTRLIPWQQHL